MAAVILSAAPLVGCARAGLDHDPSILVSKPDASSPSSPDDDADAFVPTADAGSEPVNDDAGGDGQDASTDPREPDASGLDSGSDAQEPEPPLDDLEPWPDNARVCPEEAPVNLQPTACILGLNCRYGQTYACTCYFTFWTCED